MRCRRVRPWRGCCRPRGWRRSPPDRQIRTGAAGRKATSGGPPQRSHAMIAALVLAAFIQTPEPSDLLFSEAWACSALAKAGRESHFGETTPQTDSEHAIWNALTRLEQLAGEEADRKQVSQGYDA